jgi:hypothetical protein
MRPFKDFGYFDGRIIRKEPIFGSDLKESDT